MKSQDLEDRIFNGRLALLNGVYISDSMEIADNQEQTNRAFSEKWKSYDQNPEDNEPWKLSQFQWYLKLYGFQEQDDLIQFIQQYSPSGLILDAGCGLGYKSAWLAKMNRNAIVVAMDFSDSIFQVQQRYKNEPNIVFVKGDIANTPFRENIFDFVNCDQVLHHTENPKATCFEFNRILKLGGYLNTYVYSKKALPREILDNYFRNHAKVLSHQDIWELSRQLTQLGKILSDLNIVIDVPEMPALGISGGEYDLQRFMYWNFIKCFWNEELGWDSSVKCNFDWYSPANAFRYSDQEFVEMLKGAGFQSEYLHSEEACHSGRFIKKQNFCR